MPTTTAGPVTPPGAVRAYSALLDLVTLLIVVQATLAGVFLQKDGGREGYRSWISAHNGVGAAAVVLSVAAAALAFARLRHRRDLVVGSVVLTVLLVAEDGLGSAISGGSTGLTVVHVPLAMALMGLAVWLVVRAIQLRRGNG